jgi:hypothetical protein
MEIITFILEDHSYSYSLEGVYHQLITCAQYKEECNGTGIQDITGIQGSPRSIIDIIGATAYVHRVITSAGVQWEIPSVFSRELLRAGFRNLSTLILDSDDDEIGLDALLVQFVQHSNLLHHLEIAQVSLSCRRFPALYYKLFSQVKNLYLELRNCGKHTLSRLPADAFQGVSLISPHSEINLTGLGNLQFLHLIEVNIHVANINQWVKYFNGNMHLKTLEISTSNISESVVEILFNSLPQNLENLILEENVFSDCVFNSLSKALTRLSDLRSLSLSNNLIKGSSLQKLAKALSSLQHFHSLDLSYPSSMRICDEAIEALAQISSLDTLNIKGCRIPVRMKTSLVKVIRSLPKLKSLHFRIARVPRPLDLLYLDVIKSLDEMLQSQPTYQLRGHHSLSQLLEDPLTQTSRAALKELSILYSSVKKEMLNSPDDSMLNLMNKLVFPALKAVNATFGEDIRDSLTNSMELLNDSYTFSNEYISICLPMGNMKEILNDTLDLMSNMTLRNTVSENLRFMHHYKFTRVRDNPARATLLNNASYLLTKVIHMINKILGTLKIHSHQKLIERIHKFTSVFTELVPYYVEEMTHVDYYILNENEMYDQNLNYWYEAFEGFDMNDDFNDNFWTSQHILDLFKEMSSMTNLQNLQVEFA